MKASICIATYDKPHALRRTLESIACQRPPFETEIIVVDDGSPTDETEDVCEAFSGLRYIRRWRQPGYGNPAIARNLAYQAARGEILICQSDDVVHEANTIEQMVGEMQPGRFVVANVINVDPTTMRPVGCGHPRNPTLVELSGPKRKRPLLFLGAVYRRDVYEIGGNDERFTAPGKEDMYFVNCLMKGLGLKPHFSSARGFHLHHNRPPLQVVLPSDELYAELTMAETWRAQGAPWP